MGVLGRGCGWMGVLGQGRVPLWWHSRGLGARGFPPAPQPGVPWVAGLGRAVQLCFISAAAVAVARGGGWGLRPASWEGFVGTWGGDDE